MGKKSGKTTIKKLLKAKSLSNGTKIIDGSDLDKCNSIASSLGVDPARMGVWSAMRGAHPLHIAAMTSNSGAFNELLRFGVDIAIRDSHGSSVVHYAANSLSSSMLERIRKKIQFSPDIQDDDGWAPLHSAALAGSLPCCKFLVSLDASVEVQDNKGRVPLWIAVSMGDVECCKFLLSKGASPCHPCLDKIKSHEMTPPDRFLECLSLLEECRLRRTYGNASGGNLQSKNRTGAL